jgi:flagellar biosynthesis/type III secretory pathway protein FliH
MAVLKAEHGRVDAHALQNWDVPDLQREAEAIVESARVAAESILRKAEEEASVLRENALREGHAKGLEQGHGEGLARGVEEGRSAAVQETRSEISSMMESYAASLEAYEAKRDEAIADAQAACLDLSIEIARRVVHRICVTDYTVVKEQIAQAVSMVTRPSEIEIAVNDADHQTATTLAKQLVDKFSKCRHIGVVSDPTVDRGGCLIRTAGGEIDARIETQLARIVEALVPGEGGDNDTTPWDSLA